MKKTIKIIAISVLMSGYIAGILFLTPDAQARVWLDPINSTVTTSTSSVPADNESYAVISVNAVGDDGHPFVGRSVALYSSRRDSDTITTIIGTINSDGLGVFRVKSSTSGTSTFRALVDGSEINQRATVTFTVFSASPHLALPVSVTNSTVVASPITIPADNTTYSTITVSVKNTLNSPVSGVVVSIISSRDSDAITTLVGTTNSSGHAGFRVKSSTSGTSTFRALVNGLEIAERATVTFTVFSASPHLVLPVSVTNSTVVASPTLLFADPTGENHSNITITAKNSVNGTVDISTINLTSSRGASDHITETEPLVAVANKRYFRITSGVQGISTITAVVNGITLSPIDITFANKTSVPPVPVDDPGEDDPEGATPETPVYDGGTPASSAGDEPVSSIGEDPALAVNDSGEVLNSNENDAVSSVNTSAGGSNFGNDNKTASTSGNSSLNWLWWVLLPAGGIGLIGLATFVFLKRKKNPEGIKR